MKTRLRFTSFVALLGVFITTAVFVQSGPTRAAEPGPVWGSKAVLPYFLLTKSLRTELEHTGLLTPAELARLANIALEERSQLDELETASREATGNPELSLPEKRAMVAAMNYNAQLDQIDAEAIRAVEATLPADRYEALVEWIEARWQVEVERHGVQGGSSSAPLAATAARSYSVYATRYDAGDAYGVALPDKCLKLANGGLDYCEDSGYPAGSNYKVRLAYQASATALVIESGPWNVDDNFWATVSDPQPRRMFTDLPLGMSEAQAAYFDNYNGGLDQFGREVTAPFGIDLARQVSIDIGLEPGVNDWITVTFLWTEAWAGGSEPQVVTLKQPSKLTPPYFNDMCGSAWHKITGYDGSPAYLTLNVDDSSLSTNWGEWLPDLPAAGKYKVQVYIPDHASINWECPSKYIQADTSDARYEIVHAKGTAHKTINQRPIANLWVDLGTYEFEAGKKAKVKLADLNGEEAYSRTVSFSAVRWVQELPPLDPTVTPPPVFTPTPSPTPTPTPTPQPAAWSGVGIVEPGGTISVPLSLKDLGSVGLFSVQLGVDFDPQALAALGCQADPQGLISTESCDPAYEADGENPDTIFAAASGFSSGESEVQVAEIGLQALGPEGTYTRLVIRPLEAKDLDGAPVELETYSGWICVGKCPGILYMPVAPVGGKP